MKDKLTKEFKEQKKSNSPVRLNKYLSEAGVCSRRQADQLILEKRVQIDGIVAEIGSKVEPGQKVSVNGQAIIQEEEMVLIAVNKPVGIVCTAEKKEKKNIINFLQYPYRIYPIGRLDKDSEGLLLMTNNGDIVNKMMKAGNFHEKEYIVQVDRPLTDQFLKQMAAGVPILDTVTRPCQIEAIGKFKFKIILTQGLNRQIRRMCEYLGYKVIALKRTRVMNIQLGNLKIGVWREITIRERNELYEMLQGSANTLVYNKDE